VILKNGILFSLIVIFAVASCKKSETPSVPNLPVDATADVYIVGTSVATNGYGVATYWKNGVAKKVADSLSNSIGRSITVSGTDVYVAGQSGDGSATYWKNGVAIKLSPRGITNAIAVSGEDVYVAGSTLLGATYWKNGVATVFTDNTLDYRINSIAVNGNDIYVVGYIQASDGNNNVAAYWKNGVQKKLGDSTLTSGAWGIVIKGDDVYISGTTQLNSNGLTAAVYWKNDMQHIVDTAAGAGSIIVSGSDIYLAGGIYSPNVSDSYIATYWKNGVPTKIGTPGMYAEAKDIIVNGTDVYVAGVFDGSNNTSQYYWKNNAFVKFTNSKVVYVYGMAVVPH